MVEPYFATFASRLQDRQRDLERRLAPAGIVKIPMASAQSSPKRIERITLPRTPDTARNQLVVNTIDAINENTIGRQSQIGARTRGNDKAEMRQVGLLCRQHASSITEIALALGLERWAVTQ